MSSREVESEPIVNSEVKIELPGLNGCEIRHNLLNIFDFGQLALIGVEGV
jgi:hypothetical protein